MLFPPHTVRRPGNGASRMQIRRAALVFSSAIEFDSCHFCSQEKGAGGNYNVLPNHRPDLFPLSSSELINLPPFFSLLPFHLRAAQSHKTAHLGARGGSGREVSVIQTVPLGHLL